MSIRCKGMWLLALACAAVALIAAAPAQAVQPDAVEEVETELIEPDGILHLEDLSAPPDRPLDIDELERMLDGVDLRLWVPDAGLTPVPPVKGSETRIFVEGPNSTTAPQVYVTRDTVRASLAGTGAGFSNVTEMSGANNGRYNFSSGNWWAARSLNDGANWTYVNPYATFPAFCCDQDVIFDATNRQFLWYRQGVLVGGAGGTNQIKIGRSIDNGATWCTYTITSPAAEWFDYPHLALTERYLYFTTNMFSGGGSYLRSRIYRMPLSQLAACTTASLSAFTSTSGTITPAQGGRAVLYAAQHLTTALMRLYRWVDGAAAVSLFDRAVPAWTAGAMTCLGPDGRNMCGRSDNRINGGYVGTHTTAASSGTEIISFFWNAKNNASFPKPYSDNAWFTTAAMAYGGRAYIWSSTHTFFYTHAAPNRRSEVGIVVSNNASTVHPRVCYGKDDYTDGPPPGWSLSCPAAAAGTQGPADAKWGDYNRARCYEPRCTCWLATGHKRLADGAHPVLSAFGNPMDKASCYDSWFNQP